MPPASYNVFFMPNCPAITTVSDNSLIIAAGFLDDDVLTQGNVGAPTGYTLDFLFANTQSTSSWDTMMVAHKVLTVAATENPGAFTDTGGNTDSYVAETIALRFGQYSGATTNDFKFGESGIEIATEDFVIDSSRNVFGIKTAAQQMLTYMLMEHYLYHLRPILMIVLHSFPN